MSVPHFVQGKSCGGCNRPFTSEPASLSTGITGMRCYQCMLSLRERQLAECTRVMREVAEAITSNASGVDAHVPPTFGLGDALRFQAERLLDARAGKATP